MGDKIGPSEVIGGWMIATRLPYAEAERLVEAGELCRFCYVDDSENDVTYLDNDARFYVSRQDEER